MNLDATQEPGQSRLARSVTPHLRDDWMRDVERRAAVERSGQELLRGALATIDRDQEPGVEDQSP